MEPYKIRKMLLDAAYMGAVAAFEMVGSANPMVSQTEAFSKYGRKNVEDWIQKGIVRRHKDGDKNSKIRISRLQLEAAAKTSNR